MKKQREETFPELPIQWRDSGYEIDEKLGQGSYGAVYRMVRNKGAENESFSALKVISRELDENLVRTEFGGDWEKARRMFARMFNKAVKEISILESLAGEEHIVQIKGSCIVKMPEENYCRLYIQMEYLKDLWKDLQQKEKTDQEEVIRLGIEICEALEICHKRGMIHRDIKPGNIMVADDGTFKLGDFGVAREWVDGSMTVAGSLPYVAPEVVFTAKYDKSADIYSLGMVLYYLLNGMQGPFSELDDPEERITRRLRCTDPLPGPAGAFPGMQKIILKACAHNPKERYASATEMKKDLLKVQKCPYGYCPQCGKALKKKTGPYGEFIACSGYRKGNPDSCDFRRGIEKLLEELKESYEKKVE